MVLSIVLAVMLMVQVEVSDAESYHIALLGRNTDATENKAALHVHLAASGTYAITSSPSIACANIASTAFPVNQELDCADIFPIGTQIATTAFHVDSNEEFTLHVVQNDGITQEGFLALPDSSLGTEYYVLTYCPIGGLCQFAVTPVEDDTSITVRFTNSVDLGTVCITGGDPGTSGGNDVPLTLNEYDVLHIESSQDLSGTWITSNKPVALFAGARDIPDSSGVTSQMIEQLIPVNKWGKRFIIVPNVGNDAGDIVKVIARVSNTEVYITGYSLFVIPEIGGTVTKRIDSGLDSELTASNPVLVIQLMSIDLYSEPTSVSGHPAMLLVPATSHWTTTHHLHCDVVDGADKVTMFADDGVKPTITASTGMLSWKSSTIQATDILVGAVRGIVTTEVEVTSSDVDVKFGAYGYCAENIAMLTGIDLTQDSEECEPTIMAAGDDVDNDCDGEIDEDTCTDADIHQTITIGQDGGVVLTQTLVTGGGTYTTFAVHTCNIAVVTLGEAGTSSGDTVVFQISDRDVVIEFCTPNCDIASDGTYGPGACAEERPLWISWKSNTFKVGEGAVAGASQITAAQLPGKVWYIDTMTLATIGGNATFTVDTPDQDCSKIYSGTADSIGKDFVVPVSDTAATFRVVIATQMASEVSVLPIPRTESDVADTFALAADSTREIGGTDVTFAPFSSLHITSTVEVSVYLVGGTGEKGLHIVPTDVLGPTYILATPTSATAATTCSVVTLGKQVDFSVGGQPVVTTDAYNVHTVTIATSDDPRRNRIHSIKPVAVFCTTVGTTGTVQLTPTETLGKTYYIPPIDLASCGDATGSIQIACTEDSTHVAIQGGFDEDRVGTAAGDVIERVLETNQLINISASKPVLVTLVLTGGTPPWTSASIIPAVDQYTTTHIFPAWSADEVLAYSTAVGSDGAIITSQVASPSTSGVQTMAYSTPTFTITVLKHTSDAHFVVQSDRKYEDINEVCRLSPATSVDDIDNDCDGLTNEESCTSLNTAGQVDFDIDGSINEDCYELTVNLDIIVKISLPASPVTCTTAGTVSPTWTPTTVTTNAPTTSPSESGCCCGSQLSPTQMVAVTSVFGVTWVTSYTATGVTSTQASATDAVTVSTTAAPVDTCRTDCVCPCSWSTNVTLTQEEVEELVVAIQKKLKVNKAVLSATIRKLTSAKDDRPSAVSIGYIGLAFLVVTLGAVVLLDLTTLVQDLRLLRNNLRSVFEV